MFLGCRSLFISGFPPQLLDAFGQVGCSRGRCLVAEWMFSSAAKLVIFSRGQLICLKHEDMITYGGIFSGYN